MMNSLKIRQDFPILATKVNDEPLIYLDNAATTQKPQQVIDVIEHYYETMNANVYRSPHTLSYMATEAYEGVRQRAADYLGAQSVEEIVFTKGTTHSLNLVAQGYAQSILQPGDQIGLTITEHHANLVPWQQVAKRTGAELVFLPVDPVTGQIELEQAMERITDKMRILTVSHVSNVLGVTQPIQQLAERIHQVGGVIVVDGAQAAAYHPLDVTELDVDFYALSGHKMCGPTGIGILYGKKSLLHQTQPIEFGGEMINQVGLYEANWKPAPYCFEAGTPNIAGVIGLGAAMDYLDSMGRPQIYQHVQSLTDWTIQALSKIEGVTIYGPHTPGEHAGVISFNIDQIHPHDVATAMDQLGIAIRAGHHCCQPLMRHLEVPATARASFFAYNTQSEAEQFVKAVQLTKEYFNHELK
ncbi:SufS family cysteine desulfurase [Falseniella ignava]|uniref:Cysteine desulfurase n=1 Tax=Falseniella ignava CCUG 37419 TaxID=883112 RepID=K1M7K4_9LACT|nr:SufS family cysteine desulfurase [Falseniella ignava]EKB58343.1 cysteine desulfurase, SufS subfamily [Falseniella ignava CCUG 37419]